MKHRFIAAYLLNLFDLACTLHWVKLYGIVVEGNPIGRLLLVTHLAIPIKTIGIGAAMFGLYLGIKSHPRWEWASWIVLAVYGLLALYHMILMIRILLI